MPTSSVEISGLNDLREFVQQQLCMQNELLAGAFQFTERVLEKNGTPCGISFCLHGPRNVKLIAIWETHCNTVVFYGSGGDRIGRIQLLPASQPRSVKSFRGAVPKT